MATGGVTIAPPTPVASASSSPQSTQGTWQSLAPANAAKTAYTFDKPKNGNIEITSSTVKAFTSPNTNGIITATPSSPSIPIGVPATTPMLAPQPFPLNTAVSSLVNLNLQWQESKPGHILIDSLAAAGGEKVGPISYVISDIPHVYNAYRTGGALAGSSDLAGTIAVDAAGLAGGPLAAGGTQFAVDVGQIYVAPWVGDRLYNNAPSWFTPASPAPALSASQFKVGSAPMMQVGSTFVTTNALSTPMK